MVAFAYLVYTLLFWNSFSVGVAPVVIGIYFLGSVQLAFIVMLSEYVAAIHTQVMKRLLVTARGRINFEGHRAEASAGSESLG